LGSKFEGQHKLDPIFYDALQETEPGIFLSLGQNLQRQSGEPGDGALQDGEQEEQDDEKSNRE
jgi:hypothetical protein